MYFRRTKLNFEIMRIYNIKATQKQISYLKARNMKLKSKYKAKSMS